MKLLTCRMEAHGAPRLAVRVGGRVVDVRRAARWLRGAGGVPEVPDPPGTMREALADWEAFRALLGRLAGACGGDDCLTASVDGGPVARRDEEVVHLAPVPDPPAFRDFYAFEAHVRAARARRGLEMVPEWYEAPVFYFSNPGALLGHGEPLAAPRYTAELDFELEVACVIGIGGRDIPAAEAERYIAGYTILNDWSARDVQRREMRVGLGPAKGKDFATSAGPCLVTPDELADRRAGRAFDLEMTARINGRTVSRGNLGEIHYGFPEMIERASQGAALRPGDLIGTGTVGTGCILELGPDATGGWLGPGDVVELEVERLGVLRTPIV
jgi:fumarylacetoacetate (FAA) hydrolase